MVVAQVAGRPTGGPAVVCLACDGEWKGKAMQFYDRAKVFTQAGNGGDGSPHMRHEKFAPFGGPDGGDGGRGGSVYMEADLGMNTLVDFHYHTRFKATSGGNGGKQRMHGATGDDLTLKVPAGTVIRNAETEELIADLTDAGQRVMVARGGRGGLGNTHFATATNQAPREHQRGEPGEDVALTLELKLIADVGLVGYPNAGKSTLLSVVTQARPKIANYPFTTLVPNLGVAVIGDPSRGDDYSFVIADIPGLIEGAAQGVGLGHEFLRHVERTRLLLHLVDGAETEKDPWEEYEAINRELEEYSPELASRQQIVIMTKMDLQEARDRWPALQARAEAEGVPALAISSATHDGLSELLNLTAQRLREIREEAAERAAREEALAPVGPVLRPEPEDAFIIEQMEDGFRVRGKRVERMAAMTEPGSTEGMERLEGHMRRLGVLKALEEAGVQPGDTVHFGKVELLWGDEMF
ncbi:MAG TPA: GTPase ObgE [Ktedonobacterales bacterium]|nr:GTPase ObgE [Ktedonobacterales bacterium]